MNYIALGVGLTGASQVNARLLDRVYVWLSERERVRWEAGRGGVEGGVANSKAREVEKEAKGDEKKRDEKSVGKDGETGTGEKGTGGEKRSDARKHFGRPEFRLRAFPFTSLYSLPR